MVGEVAYNRADISISDITIQQARGKVASPSVGYGTEYIQIFAPGPLQVPHFYALFKSFDLVSWVFIIGLCVIFPFIAYILLYPVSKFNLQTTMLYTIGVFFKESFLVEFYNLKGMRFGQISLIGVYLLMGGWLMVTNIITMS